MSKNRSEKNSEIKVCVKEIIVKSCCVFTVLISALYLLTTIILGNATFTTNIGNTAAIFALSFVLSAVTTVLNKKKLPFWKSNLILFFLFGAVYCIIVIFLTGMYKNPRGAMTAVGIYIFSFAVYITVKLIVRKSKSAVSEKDSEYKSKF